MTTVETAPVYQSYAHPLVSWGSVILGAVAAIALGVLLNLLVAVFDSTATLHDLADHGEAGNNLLLLGVFGALANLVALFAGGFIAARSANHPDHHDGMLHGLGVWAVSFLFAFVLLGSGANKAVGTALSQSPPAAGAGGEMSAMTPGTAASGTPTPGTPTPGAATPGAPGVGALAPATARQQSAAEADAKAEEQDEARAIARAAAETSFFGFAAMLVGLVAALVGGVLGARHPEHFAVRPRRVFVS